MKFKQGVTNKLGKAVGASGDVSKMAEALAKYKEVKAELSAPPAKKVFYKIINRLFKLNQSLRPSKRPHRSKQSQLRKSQWRSKVAKRKRRRRKR